MFRFLSVPALVTALDVRNQVNWREVLMPSFEAEHGQNWMSPGALSADVIKDAMQQIQATNGINESLLSTLPFMPQVTTLNVTMSDGVEIWTRVVNPWPHKAKKPACFVRSPYGSYATQNLALIFMVLNGHAAVMQEMRGTWRSGGVFDMWRGSNQDALDTMSWITSQEWSSGEVYSMGASADGIGVIEEVLEPNPYVQGQWMIWTTGNGHHFVYPGGAYRKDLMEGYLNLLDGPTRHASTQLVLPATQQHEAMGPWWYNLTDCANLTDPSVAPGCRYSNVKWPVILNAAWWDLFHETMLDTWNGINVASDPSFRDDHVLIVGPLGHDIAGGHDFSTAEFARLAAAEVDALVVGGELSSEFWRWSKCSNEWALDNTCKCRGRVRFGKHGAWSEAKRVDGSVKCDSKQFDDPLPGVAKECQCQEAHGKLRDRIGRVNFFVMGAFGAELPIGAGNYWTSLDDFPTPQPLNLFLDTQRLSASAPAIAGETNFVHDPKDPAPMTGGNNLPSVGSIKNCATANQLDREARADVVVFDGEPLAEDLRIVGKVSAKLFVGSNATDTDFIVTLDDLHPNGKKSMLVRYGMQRMRWRDGELTKSAAMEVGKTYEISVDMGYTAYIFPKGHRVRVSVSSAADPYWVVTTNTGKNDMVEKADPIVAQNSIHFAADMPSHVVLPTVSAEQIPKNPHFSAVGPFLGKEASVV